MSVNADEVQKWLKMIESYQPFNFIKDIGYFYISPKKFWQRWDAYTATGRTIQGILYFAILSIVLFAIGEEDYWNSFGILLLNLSVSLPFMLCVVISVMMAVTKRTEEILLKEVLLCLYAYFLFMPFQFLFFRAYFETENYMFLALAFSISIVAELYLMFVPIYVVENRAIRRIRYVLLMMILLSTCDITADKFLPVTNSTLPLVATDVISDERVELGASIQNAYIMPKYTITTGSTKKTDFVFMSPIDTTFIMDGEPSDYFAILQQDIDTLSALSGRAHFRTNKEFFKSMYMLKKECLRVYVTHSYASQPLIKRTIICYNDQPVDSLEYRYYSEKCTEWNNELFKQDNEGSQAYWNALGVLNVRYLYRLYALYKRLAENK